MAAMLPERLKRREPDSDGNFAALENSSLLTAGSLTDAPDLEREQINLRRGSEYMMKQKKIGEG